MKRLLLLLALCLLVAAPVMAAFTQNFQDGTGYTRCYTEGGATCTWTKNLTGGNSYMTSTGGTAYQNAIINSAPEQTNYAAFRSLSNVFPGMHAYDSTMAELDSCTYDGVGTTIAPDDRVEMVVSGNTISWYHNGAAFSEAGCNPAVVGVSPSYVSLGNAPVDDFTYGSSAQRVVYGMPEENVFIIKKDMLNPASSGVAFKINGTVVSSTSMTSTWSKSAIGETGGINDTLVLVNVFSGTIYAQKYTGSKNTSTEYWNVETALVNSGAPYGFYETYLLNESGSHSTPIEYLGTGASVSFDEDSYSQQDTATITHSVDGGGYWDTGAYTYKLVIFNGNTGAFVYNGTISTQSGTSTYTWTESDTQGTYYAIVIATDIATGEEIWMNYDWAEVSGYVTFTGYVNDAETELPITGANVSVVQDTTLVNQITIADGNYTATGFLTGASLSFNVTATGYSQYYASFIPMVAKSIPLNITLNSTTPTYTGLGIGGVARDGILTGTTITSGYGRPISGATVMLINTTNGESYTKTTNMAGWYLCDEGASCFLTTKRPYDIWGSKSGYSNSPNYTAVAA